MKAILSLLFLIIMVTAVWSGYKKGLIMGVGSILVIIVAVYGADLLADTFSQDVIPVIKPFASGFVETTVSENSAEILGLSAKSAASRSLEDILGGDAEKKAYFAASIYEKMGIWPKTAAVMGQKAALSAGTVTTVAAIGSVLCETFSYVLCFTLAFLLIAIILTVLGNLPNLSYKIPHLDMVNSISGAILGLLTGLAYATLLCWLLKFAGIIIGKDTLSGTFLGGFLLRKDYLLRYLGI